MTELHGSEFKNSDTCEGVAYGVDGAPSDLARITINGRYPEEGWARNQESDEMVHVNRGHGSLAIAGSDDVPLEAGTVVYIPPKSWFAWTGHNIELIMTCTPPFSPEQYEIQLPLAAIVAEYSPDDSKFYDGLDDQDMLGAVYGQLIEIGEGPDEVMQTFGVLEIENEQKGEL